MTTPEVAAKSQNSPDRRRERRRVSLRGYIIRDGGISHVIELIDLNYGGCGISSSIELRPGETIKLTVLGRGSIPAEVKWYNDGRAGLDFAPSIKSSRKEVSRRTDRISVTAEIGLRSRGRNSYRVRVFDLSTDGCKVELVELPRVGEQMSIKFDGLESLEADVCWIEGHQAGLMFQNRVHPAVFDLLVRRLAAGA